MDNYVLTHWGLAKCKKIPTKFSRNQRPIHKIYSGLYLLLKIIQRIFLLVIGSKTLPILHKLHTSDICCLIVYMSDHQICFSSLQLQSQIFLLCRLSGFIYLLVGSTGCPISGPRKLAGTWQPVCSAKKCWVIFVSVVSEF